jgi:hypothetical protein
MDLAKCMINNQYPEIQPPMTKFYSAKIGQDPTWNFGADLTDSLFTKSSIIKR